MSVADGRAKGVTGGGAAPPPDAPRETAQPIDIDAIYQHAQDVRDAAGVGGEKVLPPFNPQRRPVASVSVPGPGLPHLPVTQAATEALIADVFGTAPAVTGPRIQPTDPLGEIDPDQGVVDQLEDVLPELTDEDRMRMPAASNTDTPSKGLLPNLTPVAGDKFDGIQRGGFSDLGEAQYFPIQGDELLNVVMACAKELLAQIQNDLRFSMALVYPRVRAVVEIRIEGHAEDNNAGFEIQKVFMPKDGEKGSTPVEVARTRADEVCFVVQSLRQEFTPEGESEQPPDAMRDEFRLQIPRKQMVESGGRPSFVDVTPGSDAAALTR